MDEYKHYIRTDQAGIIIHGFSSAFEQPQEGDICVNEDGCRHYNPSLSNGQGQYIYKLNGTVIIGRSQQELTDELAARPATPDPDHELTAAIQAATTLDELKKALTGTNGRLAKVVGKMK